MHLLSLSRPYIIRVEDDYIQFYPEVNVLQKIVGYWESGKFAMTLIFADMNCYVLFSGVPYD